MSATDSARRFGFEQTATEQSVMLEDDEIDTVFIATRHGLHGAQALAALAAGKHVFVEKPLAIAAAEVLAIEAELERFGSERPLLQVGFNRRFSPAAIRVREHFSSVSSPLSVVIRVNAGSIPAEHWVHDPNEGGGRIIGEACHFIDLATFLTGSIPVRVFCDSIGGVGAPETTDDRCIITLRHANGSVSSIAYLAGGDKRLPKERIEIFGGERSAVIDDFRAVELYSGGRRKRKRYLEQDKGHQAEVDAFLAAITKGRPEPIPWREIKAVSLASILAVQSLREGFPVDIPA